jgi:hypothetical protein
LIVVREIRAADSPDDGGGQGKATVVDGQDDGR